MIVRMKKVFLVTQSKDAHNTLEKVRKLGVLHIEHLKDVKGDKVSSLNNDLALLDQALSLLSQVDKEEGKLQSTKNTLEWPVLARHIIDLHKRLQQLNDYSLTLSSKITLLKDWGDFDWKDILSLRLNGIFTRFYKLSLEDIAKLPEDVYLIKLNKQAGIYNCVIMSEGERDIPFKEEVLPKESLSKLQERAKQDLKAISLLKKELEGNVIYLDFLRNTRKRLTKELEFFEVLSGMAQEPGLIYIKGYIPCDQQSQIEKNARKEGWGLLVTDPSEEDMVPTLVRNPRWLNIISPVFKIIEVVPGYKELDISLWFLIFFSIFFGILIGDAGYGLVYFLLTFLVQKKLGARFKDKSAFVLLYILSSCAMLWGVLTATFFGQEWLPSWVRPLLPALRESKSMQTFCFLLGALHLSIAHSWRAILKFPALSFLADIGWIIILWLAFFIAKLLVLGDSLPVFYPYLITAGVTLVVLFTNPSRNVLKSLGSGLGSLLLNIMNNLTDIVSYIRLFAVGLATLAVADAFNKMAMDIGFGSILSGVLTSLILLIGHLLNIVLGPLSILVHGVRLNVLEFCSHLDIKWIGFTYKPFSEEG